VKSRSSGMVIVHQHQLLVLSKKIYNTSKKFDDLGLDHISKLGVIENEIIS